MLQLHKSSPSMWLRYFLIASAVEILCTLACKKQRSNENFARSFSESKNRYSNKEDTAAIVDEIGDGEDDEDVEEEEEEDGCSDNSAGPTVQRLPAAVIIGTKKGGTRALLEFLNIHSQIKRAKTEIHFYDKK